VHDGCPADYSTLKADFEHGRLDEDAARWPPQRRLGYELSSAKRRRRARRDWPRPAQLGLLQRQLAHQAVPDAPDVLDQRDG
jgi:hypothetical protein